MTTAVAQYRGRFAPSPTGPLHMGSMVAAVGSYLCARKANGAWIIRIEDIDPPREVPGAAADIVDTLAAFGMISDEPIAYQSQRSTLYDTALDTLRENGHLYRCVCSRKQVQDAGAKRGELGLIYPGYCRDKSVPLSQNHCLRIRTPDTAVKIIDQLQGPLIQNIYHELGDFVLRRADKLYAYQLAVTVDDAQQKINHVVRGIDLFPLTPAQCYLQTLLHFSQPNYLHLPVLVNAQGEKLSKQTGALSVDTNRPVHTLWKILYLLGQQPTEKLKSTTLKTFWAWAIENWSTDKIPKSSKIYFDAVN